MLCRLSENAFWSPQAGRELVGLDIIGKTEPVGTGIYYGIGLNSSKAHETKMGSGGTFATTKANRFLENGDMVAVEIEFPGNQDGKSLSQPGIDLIRFKDGKIVEVWLFSSDPVQEDAFWGS